MPPENDGSDLEGEIGSWAMWQRLVLSKIDQTEKRVSKHDETLGKLQIDMAVVRTRAALIGAIVGIASSAFLGALFMWLFESLKVVKP